MCQLICALADVFTVREAPEGAVAVEASRAGQQQISSRRCVPAPTRPLQLSTRSPTIAAARASPTGPPTEGCCILKIAHALQRDSPRKEEN
jgi:hypothetical protein